MERAVAEQESQECLIEHSRRRNSAIRSPGLLAMERSPEPVVAVVVGAVCEAETVVYSRRPIHQSQ